MFVSITLPAPGLAQSFALLIAGLCRATASHIAIDRSAGPLLVRIFTRLHRLAARLTSLLARIEAGRPPAPRPDHPAARRRDRRQARLPETRAWLLRLVPGTAAYAGQVQALLDDPRTAALLEAAPQAGRILRPLCRMLALPLPDHLRRPTPRPASAATGGANLDPHAESPPQPALPDRPTPPSCACRIGHDGAATVTGLPPPPD